MSVIDRWVVEVRQGQGLVLLPGEVHCRLVLECVQRGSGLVGHIRIGVGFGQLDCRREQSRQV